MLFPVTPFFTVNSTVNFMYILCSLEQQMLPWRLAAEQYRPYLLHTQSLVESGIGTYLVLVLPSKCIIMERM